MSAILGRINYDGSPVDEAAFQRAMEAEAIYGGDASSTWISHTIALGHHLLQITPESIGEVQPYTDGRLIVTADAMLCNRDELFAQLAVAPQARAAITDAALIAQAYLRWGADCPLHLIGDFAFALWDLQTQTLFCARDHMGFRPFYYHAAPGFFAFATDLRALLAFSDIPSDLDEREICTYLVNPEMLSTELTLFRAIRKLPPASRLTVQDGHLGALSPYWCPGDAPKVHFKTESEYVEGLYDLIDTAVSTRLRTSFPVGSHLSGGLDSSGVTALAARKLREQGNPLAWAYTWSPPRSEEFPPTPDDERDLIDLVCQQENIQCYAPETDLEELYRFIKEYDLSIHTSVATSDEIPILKHAGAHNIRLMLTGYGGDEAVTYAGRGYLSELLLRGKWGRLAHVLHVRKRPLRKSLASFTESALMPLMPDAIYQRFTPYLRFNRIAPLADPSFAAQYPPYQRPTLERDLAGVHRMQVALLKSGLLTLRTEGWAIWSAPYRFIYTYPLLDRRLLDYALGLPSDLVYKNGYMRYAYRAAMSKCLPKQVTWRAGKYDTNVEKKRFRRMCHTWQMFAQEVRAGQWDDAVPWVDMPRLREMLLDAPSEMTPERLNLVVRWWSAVREVYVWRSAYR